MDNAEFLKEIKPIVLNKIKQYGRYIRGYEYNDLLNEGYAAALEAVKKWESCADGNKANLISWAWLRIDCRFKDLGKIGYTYEDSLDDLDFEIGDGCLDQTMEDFFEIEQPSVEAGDIRQEIIEEEYKACLCEAKNMFKQDQGKYETFIQAMIANDFCPNTTAKQLGVTTARISQIVKKFKRLMEANKNTSLAA